MIHLVRQKGIKGRRELKAPGSSDWETQEEVKSRQIIIYHLPSALPHPFFLMKIKWLGGETSGCFEQISFVLPLLPPHFYPSLCHWEAASSTVTPSLWRVSLRGIIPFTDHMGWFVPPPPFGHHVPELSSEHKQYLPTSFIQQLSMARTVLAAKDMVMSRTDMVLWELTSHIPQQETDKRVTQ